MPAPQTRFPQLWTNCGKTPAGYLPPGPGRDIIVRECSRCHKPETFSSYHYSKDEYQTVVYRMAQRGVEATAAELDAVVDYLAKNFPRIDDPNKVNINTASAQEIAARLGVTFKEAEAIVAYRGRHGYFKAVGDLFVIYGVDGKKI